MAILPGGRSVGPEKATRAYVLDFAEGLDEEDHELPRNLACNGDSSEVLCLPSTLAYAALHFYP